MQVRQVSADDNCCLYYISFRSKNSKTISRIGLFSFADLHIYASREKVICSQIGEIRAFSNWDSRFPYGLHGSLVGIWFGAHVEVGHGTTCILPVINGLKVSNEKRVIFLSMWSRGPTAC